MLYLLTQKLSRERVIESTMCCVLKVDLDLNLRAYRPILNCTLDYLPLEIFRELPRTEYETVCNDGLVVDWTGPWGFVGVDCDF